jgi:RecA-family ATPase
MPISPGTGGDDPSCSYSSPAMRPPMAVPSTIMVMGIPYTPPNASPATMTGMAPTAVQPPPPLVEWIAASDLQGLPPIREWLVADMIPMNTVTLLYGDGGTGKSLLALQLAASTALGRLWLNRVPITGRTVYLSAEDDRAELHRRLAIIAGSLNATMNDLAAITIADLAGKDALLANVNVRKGTLSRTALMDQIDARIAVTAPRLVVVDTLADAYPGNENDRAMVRQFVGMMRGLAIKHRCAVILLAHPSLTGINTGTGASGSTAWNNSVRSRLYLARIKDGDHEPDIDARRLKVMKSNYGRVGAEISMTWRDGVFIAQQDGIAVDNDARAERIFLALIEQLAAQGRYLNELHAPKTLSEMPGCEGLTKRKMKDAMERLFNNCKIGKREIMENRRSRSVIIVLS